MRTLLLTTALLLPSFALAAGDEHSDHKAEIEGVEIIHAWTRATDGDHADVYVEIHNESGQEIMLKGGHAEGMASEVKLMGAPIQAGSAPIMVPEVAIASGVEMDLSPEGVYLHLDGITKALAKGDEFEMELIIAPFGEVEIHVEVEAADATQHSHAGHNH